MKKLSLLLFVICWAYALSAQVTKGTIFVGAASNFGYNNLSPDSSSGFTIMNIDLKSAYFLIDNLAGGVNIGYDKIDEFSQTSIGLFGRYYIKGKVFVGAGFNSVKPDSGSSTTEIPFEIGFAAFITDNIAVEPSARYVIGDGYEEFGLNIGFGLYFNR